MLLLFLPPLYMHFESNFPLFLIWFPKLIRSFQNWHCSYLWSARLQILIRWPQSHLPKRHNLLILWLPNKMPFFSKDSKVNAFLERGLAALRRNPTAPRWHGADFLRDAHENDYDRDNFLRALLDDEQHPILNKQDKFTDNLLFAAARQYSWGIPKKGWVREQTETGTQDKAIVIFESGRKKLTSNGKNKAIQILRGVNNLRTGVHLPIELEALDLMVDYCNQAELILGLRPSRQDLRGSPSI